MRAHQAGRPHCRRSASRTQQASRQQRTVQEQRTSHRDPNRNGNSDDAAADYGVRARRESRSQHQLHSGGALPMHNMHAFSVVVTRHSMVVLVEASRARCRSQHHPGRPFTPLAAPRVGPTAACLGAARTPPAPSTAHPLAGVELLGRVVDKERGRTQEIRVCMRRTAGSPRQHVHTEEKPRGVSFRFLTVIFERVGLLPAARSHSAGGNRAPSLPGLVRTSS